MRRTETCYSCRHWNGAGIRGKGPKGQCRRFPPVVTDRAPQGSFPTTDSADWCGEWLRAIGAAPEAAPREEATGGTLYDEL